MLAANRMRRRKWNENIQSLVDNTKVHSIIYIWDQMQCCIAPSHSLKAERQRSRQLIWWFGLMTMQKKINKKMDRWVTLWLNGIQGNRSERETQKEKKKKPEGEKVRWSGQGWQEGEFAHLISSDSSDYVSTRLFDTSPIFSPLPCLVLSSALLVIGCLWLRHVMIIM